MVPPVLKVNIPSYDKGVTELPIGPQTAKYLIP